MSEFLQKYPDIELDIQCTDVKQDIIDEGLDLVIRVGHLVDSSYVAVTLAHVGMVICASPEYLEKYGTPQSPGDLLNHNCVVYDGYDEWEFNKVCKTQNCPTQLVNVTGNINTNMVTVILAALKQNLSISLLPDLLIRDQLQSGALMNVMPDYKINVKNLIVDRVFALYSNRKHLPAKTRAFIDFYRDKFK